MRRRDFLGGVPAAAVVPLVARGQHSSAPVIGFLNSASPGPYAHVVAAFRDGLKETGFNEGVNVRIEYRWAESHYERLPALVEELIALRVAVIAATSTPAALAAKAATTLIPVVFTTGSNPVELGLIESLARPGANITGSTQMAVEVAPKRLELLHELFPTKKSVALLLNPAGPNAEAVKREARRAAQALGKELHVLSASTESEINTAFGKAAELRVGGLVIGNDAFFNTRNHQFASLTLQHKLPAIYHYREFAAAGGLLAYGGSLTASYRIAGLLAGRILKGERPADLPVQQTTKLELIINLNTAKALNLTVPLSLLGRADEVIE